MMLPERRPVQRVGSVLGPLVIALIMGGVAFAAFQDLGPTPFHLSAAPWIQKTTVSKSAPEILLAAPLNNGKTDKLYAFDPQAQTVTEKAVPSGWRANDLENREIKVQMPESRSGTASLITNDGAKIPLQTASGQTYQSAQILGALDPQHTAVVGKGDQQDLLSVNAAGQVKKIVTIPDNANALPVNQGTAWFATYQPCGGLENPARGPSSLVRVNADGTTTTVATSPERVISAVLGGPNGALAYSLDDGSTVVRSGNLQWSGTGKPLLWQDDHDLLVAHGTLVQRLNLQDGTLTTLTTLPQAPSMASVGN